ncbi:MAG: hypothetical protein N3A69_15895, partial [Leptospiraceae bacterium]|nr:hypothetical protein [Leptospiraceae bacterium]
WSTDTIIVNEFTEEINISSFLDYYLDESKTWRIEEIYKLKELFSPNQKDYLDLHFKSASVWLHFKVKNTSKRDLEFFVTIPLPALDYAEFFIRSTQSKWFSTVAGDTIPINKWSIKDYVHPTFKLEIPAQKELSYFLNLKSTSYIRTPIYLQSKNRKDSYENLFKATERSLYFVILVLVGIAGYFYFKFYEKVFFLFIFSFLAYYLNVWLIQGMGYKILLGNLPDIQNRSQIFFLSFSLIASLYSIKEILKRREFFTKRIKNVLEILSFSLFCLAFLCFMGLEVVLRIYIFNVIFFIYFFTIIWLSFCILKSKKILLHEVFFFGGFLCIFSFGILNSLFTVGLLSFSHFYLYSLTLFSPFCFSGILYSLWLFAKFNLDK